jgi:hypothetical protein
MNKERLLNVAKALRESKNPERFSMKTFIHGKWGETPEHWCGSPACALGHYVARPDLQSEFYVHESHMLRRNTHKAVFTQGFVDHFGIEFEEYDELFDEQGCGNAKTPEEAAQYIERFVEVATK